MSDQQVRHRSRSRGPDRSHVMRIEDVNNLLDSLETARRVGELAAPVVRGAINLGKRAWSGNDRSEPKKTKMRKTRHVVAKGGKISARGGKRIRKSKKVKFTRKKTLGSRLKRVERELKSDMSYKYQKNVHTFPVVCAVGSSVAAEGIAIDSGDIRSSITALPIGTGTAINGTGVAENTQLTIKNCWSELVAANITDTACFVNIYACRIKTNSAVGALASYHNANDDSGLNVVAAGAMEVTAYPTLFPDFKKQVTIVDSVRCYLRAGDQAKLSFSIPDFKWSDDYYDDHPVQYLKGKNMVFLIRVEGDVCFDVVDLNRGSTAPSKLMCKMRTNFTVEYAGNVASRIFDTDNTMQTSAFTGVPTQVGPNVIDIQE